MIESETVERKRREQEENDRAPLKIASEMEAFLQAHSDIENLTEEDILQLFSNIGHIEAKSDLFILGYDQEKTNRILEFLEKKGYKAKPYQQKYRTVRSMFEKLGVGDQMYAVGNSYVICRDGEKIPEYTSEELAKYAIENAMGQLRDGKISYANEDFLHMYRDLKEKESKLENNKDKEEDQRD